MMSAEEEKTLKSTEDRALQELILIHQITHAFRNGDYNDDLLMGSYREDMTELRSHMDADLEKLTKLMG